MFLNKNLVFNWVVTKAGMTSIIVHNFMTSKPGIVYCIILCGKQKGFFLF